MYSSIADRRRQLRECSLLPKLSSRGYNPWRVELYAFPSNTYYCAMLNMLSSRQNAILLWLHFSADPQPLEPLDETPQLSNQSGGYNFTRNLTTKGSRYGTKSPLKHIYASDGARLILDKFNNNNQPSQPPCASKQYYGELPPPALFAFLFPASRLAYPYDCMLLSYHRMIQLTYMPLHY